MTTTGAYQVLKKFAGQVREHAKDIDSNIKALYATRTVPEDPALTQKLREALAEYGQIEQTLEAVKAKTFDVSKGYLEANRERVRKGYKLRKGRENVRVVV
jgi:hypothetical protein